MRRSSEADLLDAPDNADAYPRILQDEVVEMIAGNNVAGYRGIDLLRRQNETKSSLLGSCGSTRWALSNNSRGPTTSVCSSVHRLGAVLKRFDERAEH